MAAPVGAPALPGGSSCSAGTGTPPAAPPPGGALPRLPPSIAPSLPRRAFLVGTAASPSPFAPAPVPAPALALALAGLPGAGLRLPVARFGDRWPCVEGRDIGESPPPPPSDGSFFPLTTPAAATHTRPTSVGVG